MNINIKKIRKFEFESRIFISFAIVLFICVLSFTVFEHIPANSVFIGKCFGLSAEDSLTLGYLMTAFIMVCASFIRIWAGSILSSQRMMAFHVQVDTMVIKGPYLVSRNPIYLADLMAFFGFALCLPFIGLLLPVLLYLHYTQLIKYEEISLLKQFQNQYQDYKEQVSRLIPNPRSVFKLIPAFKSLNINYDGVRHNTLYLFFIPGFIAAAFTRKLLWAIIIGLPAVFDWAVIHTKIGTAKNPVTREPGSRKNPGVKQSNKKVFQDILYAQCWEDPQIDREALKIGKDDVVFSITSGGCNVLTFLLDNPRKIIALDMNPQQNFLLDLKIAAFKRLSYEKMLEFLGVRESNDRLQLYNGLRPFLESDSFKYWDRQEKKIKRGIIHCGRYEGYMRLLKKIVVNLLMKRSLIDKFFETEDTAARVELFNKKLKNTRWWLLTRVMLSRFLNSLLFDKAFFAYLDENFSFGKHFANKAERAFTQLPVKENYFLAYILLGRFPDKKYLPHYLRKANYSIIKSRINRIELVTDTCEHFFAMLPDSCIAKFNFSNIFEWMSPGTYRDLLLETIRVAKNKAIMTYRNLLAFREHPTSLDPNIRSKKRIAKLLLQQDLSFIYNNYVVEEIQKGGGTPNLKNPRR